jgi:hypothetical protein
MGSRAWPVVGCLLLGFALPASASATTWQVTSTGDNSPTCPSASSCTLRGAIDQADVAGGGDVVQVPAGHYTVNVNPINVTSAMQIVGTAGSAATTVEYSSGTNGILAISSGAGSVTVSGLTFTGGHNADGGAIESQAAALTLSNDVFTGNAPSAAGAQGDGGAVDVSGSAPTSLTVTGSTFSSNRAGGDGGSASQSGFGLGGAIAFRTGGTLSVSDSSFSDNRAGGNGGTGGQSGGGAGGAIYASPTTFTDRVDVTVTRSVFSGNHAGGNGGDSGIASSGGGDGGAIAVGVDPGPGSLSIADSSFSGNQTGGAGAGGSGSGAGSGGAVQASGLEGSAIAVSVLRSTFSQNSAGGTGGSAFDAGAASGGAIRATSDSASSTFAATDSTFDANRAGGTAGAGMDSGIGIGGTIYVAMTGTASFVSDTIARGNAGGENGRGGNLTSGTPGASLENTILSHGIADTGANCSGPITSLGHNIETANECGLSAAGDHPSSEPMLGALVDNGGLTQTIAPLAGSPATDGGDNAACPATDQRGALRPAGAACDIGAYELATPAASTGAVSAVHATSATLNGVAFNPDLGPGSASFQFGASTAYGGGAGSQALAALAPQTAVAVRLGGLTPKTTYHFRLAASNGAGSGVGADQSFTTTGGAALSHIRLRPARIVAQKGRGASITRAKRKKGGGALSFDASEPGTTTFTVQRPLRGYRSGKRCVARKPHGKRRARRCTLYRSLGSFGARTTAGANRRHFTGRVKRRPLKVGAYRLRLVERDADGHNGPANTRSFRIVG